MRYNTGLERLRKAVFTLIAVASCGALHAQFSVSFMPGYFLKHTENLAFEIPEMPLAASVIFHVKNQRGSDWVKYYGYPEVGLRLGYQSFDSPEVLGAAAFVYPEISFFPFGKGGRVQPVLTAGTGLGLLTRRYEFSDNPTNNAISSVLNNVTGLAVGLRAAVGGGNSLYAGLRLSHFSNAKISAPNLGVNVLSADLAFQFGGRNGEAQPVYDKPSGRRGWFVEAGGVMALTEYAVPGGPKFPVYSGTVMGGWSFSAHQSLLLMGSWQLSTVERVFGEAVFAFEDEAEAERAGQKWAGAIGLESRFHRFAVSVFAGLYLWETEPRAGSRLFNMIRLQYLVPVSDKFSLAPGLQFKSKQITAEYIGVMVGLRFNKNE